MFYKIQKNRTVFSLFNYFYYSIALQLQYYLWLWFVQVKLTNFAISITLLRVPWWYGWMSITTFPLQRWISKILLFKKQLYRKNNSLILLSWSNILHLVKIEWSFQNIRPSSPSPMFAYVPLEPELDMN